MYYWCIVDMLKIATHVYTTIPTYIKNIIFRNYIVSTIHIKKIRIEYVLKSADVGTLFSGRNSDNSSHTHVYTHAYPHTHPHPHAPPSHTHAYPHTPPQTRTHPTHTH